MRSPAASPSKAHATYKPALVSFLWGFAEATFFFIVPDVYSSRRAIESYRSGFVSCLWALAGALCGGALLFAWSRQPDFAEAALQWFDCLPGISPELVDTTAKRLQSQGAAGFFTSAATGVPYKLCVVHAAAGGLSWGTFLAVSISARLLRFTLVTLAVGFVAQQLPRSVSRASKSWIHAAAWALFYVIYFAVMQ